MTNFTSSQNLPELTWDFLHQARLGGIVGGAENSAPGSAISLLAGGGARLLAVTVVSPLELVRTKMQSQKLAWSELRSCLRGLVAAQVLAAAPAPLQFLVRECEGCGTDTRQLCCGTFPSPPCTGRCTSGLRIKSADRRRPLTGSQLCISLLISITLLVSFLVNFTAGAVAGSVASTITLPFDVIKTLKQIEIGERDIMGVRPGRQRGLVGGRWFLPFSSYRFDVFRAGERKPGYCWRAC